ncbi:glycosyltransferase [Enterococcus italicus]|uniref:glycosyltransferase n=1 Tax=Enterococcus italicus TaxID=246144 RepID=UPI002072CD4E|nr:glycosyltransferase [Enterococcus italicus]MCM6881815.1 glycosyltransferase [Enterococcus italicus]
MINVTFAVRSIDMGGAQRVTSRIVNQLDLDDKFTITMYSSEKSESFFPLNITPTFPTKPIKRVDMVVHRVIEKASFLFFKKKKNTYPSLGRIKEDFFNYIINTKPDIVVLQEQFILFMEDLKIEFPNIKFIYWAHNNIDMLREKYFCETEQLLLDSFQKCDAVVSLTDYDDKKISNFTQKSYRIYNPLTMDISSEHSKLDKKIISFVGRIDIPHKGIDYLVEIASMIPADWKISIAGSGNFFSMHKFQKLINKYNAKDKIIYKGKLQDKDLSEHYLNSSIFIHTSRWEGFPLVLMEAMNYGLPIVAFNNTGSNEALSYGEMGLLIKNGDRDSMVKEIVKLSNNHNLLESHQKKSLNQVQNFSIEKITIEWKNLFTTIMSDAD